MQVHLKHYFFSSLELQTKPNRCTCFGYFMDLKVRQRSCKVYWELFPNSRLPAYQAVLDDQECQNFKCIQILA